MSTTVLAAPPGSRSGTWSRVGLVLAATMSMFNIVNGAGSLIDPSFGQLDPDTPAQPVWMSLLLLGFGLATLVAVVPAWRGSRRALWVVIVTRLLEAWSALILPFLPGAPEGLWVAVVGLIVLGTTVAGLVALGLRR